MGAAIAEFFGSTVVYFLIGQDFNSYHNINTLIALLTYKVVSITCRRSQSAFYNRRASDEQQSRRRVFTSFSTVQDPHVPRQQCQDPRSIQFHQAVNSNSGNFPGILM